MVADPSSPSEVDLMSLLVLIFLSLLAKKKAHFPHSLRKNYFPDSIGIHKAEFCSARMDPVAIYGEAVSSFYLVVCG